MNNYHEILTEALSGANDWEFVGGDIRPNHINRWNLKFPNQEMPGQVLECECSHPIKENCYIYSKQLDEIKIIGNCCVKRFLPNKEDRELKCELCKIPHRNRKVNRCNNCKRLPLINFFVCKEHKVKDCDICAIGSWNQKISENDIQYYKWINHSYVYLGYTKYNNIYIKIQGIDTIFTNFKVINSDTILLLEQRINDNL
jgi:hypothetical protein